MIAVEMILIKFAADPFVKLSGCSRGLKRLFEVRLLRGQIGVNDSLEVDYVQ